MKLVTRKLTVGLAASLFAMSFIATPVLAHNGAHDSNETQTSTQTATTGISDDSQHQETELQSSQSDQDNRKSKPATKLEAAKLKVCKSRESKIKDKMAKIVTRGQKQIDLFSSIATKTEKFYAEKGNALSNYDALVSDVNAKKTSAQAALDNLKSLSVSFKCDGTDPKGAASSFKEALKTEIAALKAYKTSVKNLIVGVKSVQPDDDSTESSTGNN